MNKSRLSVIHVDTERSWRGGQQQVVYLHEGLLQEGIKSFVLCRPSSALEKYLKEKRLPHMAVSMRNEADLFSAWKIANAARTHGATVVHLHSAHALSLGILSTFFYGTPKLVGARRVALPIRKNFFSRRKYLTPRVACHVAISEGVRKVMVEDGVDPDKIVTIHSGVDLERMSSVASEPGLKRRLGIPEDHLVVGTVAALTREKGYSTLIDAAASVVNQFPKVTFCALGDGAERSLLEARVEEAGLKERFLFLGFQKVVAPFFHLFDIYVQPSFFEGLGTSIMDAQTLGLPVIGSRVGGIPELVVDGLNGFLVEPGDEEGFGLRICEMLESPKLRSEFGDAARQSITSFSVSECVKKSLELYKRLSCSE